MILRGTRKTLSSYFLMEYSPRCKLSLQLSQRLTIDYQPVASPAAIAELNAAVRAIVNSHQAALAAA